MPRIRIGFTPEEPDEEFDRDENNDTVIPLYIDQPTIDDPEEWLEDDDE